MSTTKVSFQRALVVEDNAPIRKSLVRVASAWAREVIPAATVREAMAELSRSPDLLIADVQLPDGWLTDLLESEAWQRSNAVVVAVSGRASTEVTFRLGQLGVHAFLSKPFGLRDLEHLLANLGARRRVDAATPVANSPFEAELKSYARARRLTEQQTAILRALLCGASRKNLAKTLSISENTCKTTVRRLLVRCQARRIADVVNELMSRSVSASSLSDR